MATQAYVRWSYKIQPLIADLLAEGPDQIALLEKELNRIGKQGWELVAVLDCDEGTRLSIFKRPHHTVPQP